MRTMLFCGAAAAALLWPQPASADVATDWWEIANRYYLEGQSAGGQRTPDAERASSRAALAMFEAVNAIDRRYQSYLGLPVGDAAASQDAAAATAAFHVLVRHYPAHRAVLEEGYAMTMASIREGAAKEAGTRIGAQAAEAAMAARGIDPAITQPPYRPRTTPGMWIGASLPALRSYWLAFTPWVVRIESLRVPPPPPPTSERYARDYEEVRRLGGHNSGERTPVQTLIARYRQGYDLTPMVRYITDRPGRRQVDNARLLAIYQMAFDDAVQVMVAEKIRHEYWRPITAIRNGDQDGNDRTEHDPDWVPLLGTPNFQEYPCGHCTAVAVQSEVLKLASGLPLNTPVRVAAGGNPNMVVQTVAGWDELVRQVSDSRMFGGVHFRFSNEAGEEIGRRVARIATETLLQPLPRPGRH